MWVAVRILDWRNISISNNVGGVKQFSSICLVHKPKNPIPAGVRRKHVIVARGMKQDLGAFDQRTSKPSCKTPSLRGLADPAACRHPKERGAASSVEGLGPQPGSNQK